MYRLLLSIRYFRSRFLALAALLAITFGVAMLLIVLSLMGGYLVELREKIRGQESHLQIRGHGENDLTRISRLEEALRRVANVAATAPFIERLAIYRSGLSLSPCALKGIDPARQLQVSDFGRQVLRPAELEQVLAEVLPGPGAGGEEPVKVDLEAANRALHKVVAERDREPLRAVELEGLLAKEWRRELLLRADPGMLEVLGGEIPPAAIVSIQLLLERQMFLGQVISLITLNPETEEPLTREFLVAGALKSGDFELDAGTIYVDLDRLKNSLELFDAETNSYRYQGLRIAVKDPERLEETAAEVEAVLEDLDPRLEVKTWKELRQNLLRAVKIEKFLVYFLVLILVAFTGSMILLMLFLTVIEKTRDVGILMALGATARGVTEIFLLNGLAICIAGTLLGLGLGFAFCSNINDVHDAIQRLTGVSLFPAEIYHMDRIPIAFEPADILLTTIPPVLIGLVASLIPALWAPRRDPIKAIQYE
jgi:lipoprotein-releasing system permease protein